METFETIKKFLEEGGKCLLIENGKPIGVVLTIEEYELLKSKSSPEAEKLLIPRINNERINNEQAVNSANPIGEAMIKEMEFPEASAALEDIKLADDITLEDLGLDELPY